MIATRNMFSWISLLVLLFGTLNFTACQENQTFETPEYIIPCYKKDPEINKCITNTFNHLRPYLINGIKEISVPSIDPFRIDKIVIENGQGALRIKASFFNVSASGASNYSVSSVRADVNNYNIEMKLKIPRIEIKGKYDVNGNVLLFPVRSKGDFWAVFLEVDAVARIFGKEVKNKQNVRFMKIDRMFVDFKLAKSRFRIKDIINHGNIIGDAMNQFLNTNSDEIIKEMKPAANVAIAKHFKNFLNSAFLRLPLQVWLPDA